jgi:hypothetical protein
MRDRWLIIASPAQTHAAMNPTDIVTTEAMEASTTSAHPERIVQIVERSVLVPTNEDEWPQIEAPARTLAVPALMGIVTMEVLEVNTTCAQSERIVKTAAVKICARVQI